MISVTRGAFTESIEQSPTPRQNACPVRDPDSLRHRRRGMNQNQDEADIVPHAKNLQMFGVTGAGLSQIRAMQNGGKRARRSLDQWDRVNNPQERIRTPNR